jgi:hypothetical protein
VPTRILGGWAQERAGEELISSPACFVVGLPVPRRETGGRKEPHYKKTSFAALQIAAILTVLSAPARVCAQIVIADPNHLLCRIEPWSQTFSDPNITKPPTTGDRYDFGYANLLLNQVPPAGTPDCQYETSDITKVDVTLTFQGFPLTPVSVTVSVPGLVGTKGTMEFTSGVTKSLEFPAHAGGGIALHITLPNAPASVGFNELTSQNGVPVYPSTATLKFSGNHYYLAVPEPSALVLLCLGVVCFSACALNRRRAA